MISFPINCFISMLSLLIVIILFMILVGLFVVITHLIFVTFLLINAIASITYETFIISSAIIILFVVFISSISQPFSHTFSCMSLHRLVNVMMDS